MRKPSNGSGSAPSGALFTIVHELDDPVSGVRVRNPWSNTHSPARVALPCHSGSMKRSTWTASPLPVTLLLDALCPIERPHGIRLSTVDPEPGHVVAALESVTDSSPLLGFLRSGDQLFASSSVVNGPSRSSASWADRPTERVAIARADTPTATARHMRVRSFGFSVTVEGLIASPRKGVGDRIDLSTNSFDRQQKSRRVVDRSSRLVRCCYMNGQSLHEARE